MPSPVPACGYEKTSAWVNDWGVNVRRLIEQEAPIIRTHLRDEPSVVARDNLELDSTLHLLVEFTYFRNVP